MLFDSWERRLDQFSNGVSSSPSRHLIQWFAFPPQYGLTTDINEPNLLVKSIENSFSARQALGVGLLSAYA